MKKVCDLITHIENLQVLSIYDIKVNGLPANVKNLKLVKNMVIICCDISDDDFKTLKEIGIRVVLNSKNLNK